MKADFYLAPRIFERCLLGLALGIPGSLNASLAAASDNVGNSVVVRIVPAISGNMILPDAISLPGVASETISVTAARGQFESASFVLRPGKNGLTNVALSAADLKSLTGTIPAGNVDIKSVKTWYQAGPYAWIDVGISKKGKAPMLIPKLLLNDDALVVVDRVRRINTVRLGSAAYVSVSEPSESTSTPRSYSFSEFPVRDAETFRPIKLLPPGEIKQFWVTVHVPDNAPAGEYDGAITLSANDDALRELKLRVTVPVFDLLDSPIESTIYYRATLNPPLARIGDGNINEEQYRAEMLDLKNHGVKNPTMYQDQDSPYFAQELSIRRKLGMTGGPLYSLGAQPNAASDPSVLDAKIPGQLALIRSYGFSDYYLYGRDEASGADLAAEKPLFKRVHELGAKVFVAGDDEAFGRIGNRIDLLVHAGRKKPAYAQLWHRVGRKIYSYADPQCGAGNPQLYRLHFGVVLWAAGYDGSMDYAYQHSFGRPWNDFDDPTYRDHMFTYPTINGIVGTLAWEGYREAHDDNRYLATLQAAITSGLASGDPSRRAAAADARRYLDDLRTTVLSSLGTGPKTADFPMDLYAMRKTVTDYISALTPRKK